MLSVENYENVQNYEIIAKLHQVIKKEITNFLVIFNKMDLSQNPTQDIKQCKGKFIEYFPKFQTFNVNLNTFIPMSMLALENELLMDKSFKHYITNHFYNFLMRNNLEVNENHMYNNFKNHLLNILNAFRVKKKDIKSKIEIFLKQNNIKEINKEINEIINNLNNICKDKDIILDLDILDNNRYSENNEDEDEVKDEDNEDDDNNLYDIKAIDILYYFYNCYKEKTIMMPISKETLNLLDYFKNNNKEMKSIKNINIDLKTKANRNIINILKELSNHLEKLKINIQKNKNVIDIIRKLIDYLNTFNIIFIPFLGPTNAGKTTIINGIIGKDLLPTGMRECTKRGIIIAYGNVNDDDMFIANISFEKEKYLNEHKFYFQRKSIIGKGLAQVKDTLNGLNNKFPKSEKDSFYYIKTKIKLYDELGLDENLKKMIYLIDFPGFGTENFFENNIYKNVMTICNSFFFIVKNLKINENNNALILNNLFFKTMDQTNIISTNKFIKSCFFIVNNQKEQTTSNNDLELGKRQIQEIIKNEIKKENINLSFFNAEFYSHFNNYYNYFFFLFNLFKKEYKNFQEYNSNIFKYPEKYISIKKYKTFYDYLNTSIKNKMIILFQNSNKKFDCKISPEIENQIEKIVNQNIYFNLDNKKIKKLAKDISFSQENINKLEYLEKSGVINFKKIFLEQIYFINDEIQKKLNEKVFIFY